MANIYQKAFTGNPGATTEQLYNLGIRERFMRKTNLPANWLKVRLGIIASLTGATGDNVSPVADNINNASSPILHNSWLFGLYDGTSGFPGDVGAGKFVGVKNYAATGALLYTYFYATDSTWHIDASATGTGSPPPFFPTRSNGATVAVGTNSATTNLITHSDPTAGSGAICFGLCIELDVSTAGSMWLGAQVANKLSRTDDPQMSAVLTQTLVYASTALTGGWWDNSGSNPVNCQHFFIRWPMSLNTLRIHNMRAMQLA